MNVEENLSNLQLSSTQSNNNELVEVIDIQETPFTARKFEDVWIVTVGKYKLSPNLQTYEECQEFVKNPTWDMITALIQTLIEINTLNTK